MDCRQVIRDFASCFHLQVLVKSVSEFQNLYSTACLSLKGAPKKGGQRSHMGLIVNVVSRNECVGSIVSKMNFVDLAGYNLCYERCKIIFYFSFLVP